MSFINNIKRLFGLPTPKKPIPLDLQYENAALLCDRLGSGYASVLVVSKTLFELDEFSRYLKASRNDTFVVHTVTAATPPSVRHEGYAHLQNGSAIVLMSKQLALTGWAIRDLLWPYHVISLQELSTDAAIQLLGRARPVDEAMVWTPTSCISQADVGSPLMYDSPLKITKIDPLSYKKAINKLVPKAL